MLNHDEVFEYIKYELPEIKNNVTAFSHTSNIFLITQLLANYTKRKVADHDMTVVKKCFAVAENIYIKGSDKIKAAIENVYIYSFSSLLYSCNNDERCQINSIMPLNLRSAYMLQVLKSGI